MGIVAAVLLLVTIYCGSDVLAPFEARLFHHCYRLVCGDWGDQEFYCGDCYPHPRSVARS